MVPLLLLCEDTMRRHHMNQEAVLICPQICPHLDCKILAAKAVRNECCLRATRLGIVGALSRASRQHIASRRRLGERGRPGRSLAGSQMRAGPSTGCHRKRIHRDQRPRLTALAACRGHSSMPGWRPGKEQRVLILRGKPETTAPGEAAQS